MESFEPHKAKVSAKGRVVIPAALRKRFGIKPGTSIVFQEAADGIVLVPETTDPVDALFGKPAQEKLPDLLALKYRTAGDAVAELRTVAEMRDVFIGFREHPYALCFILERQRALREMHAISTPYPLSSNGRAALVSCRVRSSW